jgi:hypothetical protein
LDWLPSSGRKSERKEMRGGLINGKGEKRKARMPHHFHLSMSVFGTIKLIEDVGCCSKLKNYYILFLKNIGF